MTTLTVKEPCPRCGGNLYGWEGAVKCLQCSRIFGGPRLPEGIPIRRHYEPAFKNEAVQRALVLHSWVEAALEFGVDPRTLKMWSYKTDAIR